MSIVSGGFRDDTFRDSTGKGGPFRVMRCDGCGTESEMVRKYPDNRNVLTSPPGWVDDGPLDKCPKCAPGPERSKP